MYDYSVLRFSDKSEKQLQTDINHDLQRFYKWICGNKLVLNEGKTVYLIYDLQQKIRKKPEYKCYTE